MDPVTESSEIARALKLALPIVALESTVITHGLPPPQNLSLARDMEAAVRHQGATPATIGILKGQIRIGLTEPELEELSRSQAMKVSRRDIAAAIIKKAEGGTTVAATMQIAQEAGIRVFATGGIGGVHRESRHDVSADLQALANIPMIVVCAGAKAILDLPATVEYLETMSVPVVGYQTDEFPAFYSRESGLKTSLRLDTPEEIAAFADAQIKTGLLSSVLVVNPVPVAAAIPKKEMDPLIAQASEEAQHQQITGQKLTPFLLERIRQLTGGRSMHANISLLLNNAQLAAQIARARVSVQRARAI
jgi:pseudouridine-5'-phosphate glycosidase